MEQVRTERSGLLLACLPLARGLFSRLATDLREAAMDNLVSDLEMILRGLI